MVGLATTLALGAASPARADEAGGHYTLALQYKREGKLPDAIAECQRALQLRPDYAAAHFTLGNLYRGQGDYAR
ncbi:MAG TPA: tetratricopeptide repeat protein, partial [Polyangia bacterium]|nr:tetratricopeptide repeat protein [Polyangia bacterium]